MKIVCATNQAVIKSDHPRPCLTCLCLLILSHLAVAQQPPSPAQPGGPAVRVATRLVEVNVIVQDKSGEPVSNLIRDDFTLLDRGKVQRISVFSQESARPPLPAALALPADTFSNQVDQSETSPRNATAILLDGLNTRFTDRPYARQQIIRFLQQLQPQDCVALYVLAQGVRVIHDFTSDPAPLLAALAEEGKHPSAALVDSEYDPLATGWGQFDAWMGEVSHNVAERYRADRALRTIRTLLAIAEHLERLPGRKNLIWVAGSFPAWFDRDRLSSAKHLKSGRNNFGAEIEQTARGLNHANVAIYPVDARGLVAPAEYSPDRASISRQMLRSGHGQISAMLDLAARTGGRAFYNSNDIRGAIRSAVDDARVTYTLSYHPAPAVWDGRFHEIKVKVNRPGVRVRCRRGYFALPEEPEDESHRQAVLDAAMWNPIDATGVGLTVRAVPAGQALELELRIDPRNVTLQPKNGKWTGAVDLRMVQFAPGERDLGSSSFMVNLALDRETYWASMQGRALLLSQRLEVVPGATVLRVLVRDISSGLLGSVTIPLGRVRPADPGGNEAGVDSAQ